MKFKKIYIEITNICNLNCSFCAKNNRKQEFISLDRFMYILDQIKNYTEYIYLHVMGEPLLHPEINKIIKFANEKGLKVNITTNGFLIDKLNNNDIRQINISLHSVHEQTVINKDVYLNKIFNKCEELAEKGVYINYRVWRSNCLDILSILEERYNIKIKIEDKTKILSNNIFYSKEEEFIWPIERLGEGNNYSSGGCRALKDHIAILVDGTIVPCCLDNNGTIPLGNIFDNNLSDIINSSTYKKLVTGFNENKKIHPLCQNCNFYDQK